MASKSIATLCLTLLLLLSTLCSISAVPKIPRKFPPVNPFCPWDALKFGACAGLLGDPAGLVLGEPPGSECCALIGGLKSAEAAACLCTAIKESVLGVATEWDIGISLLVSSCRNEVPDGFKCF